MSILFDTPHRDSSASVTGNAEATPADKVMAAVKKDINRNVVLIPGKLFLDNILFKHVVQIPDDKVVNVIMNQFYDMAAQHWKGFPKSGKEDQFYSKFVELANNINDKASVLFGASTDRALGRWVDCHSQIPNANADFVAEIRPDCAFVSNEQVVKQVIGSYTSKKLAEPLFQQSEATVVRTCLPFLLIKFPFFFTKEPKIWWRQMLVVVEVKREDGEKLYLGAFPQLCNYVRQMFRQQLDRRFVLGITISFNNISMWVCDRSGGMGMSKPYDIHKNPKDLVRMIGAIALLPSHRMGWDPTLKLYNDAKHLFQPSYHILATLKTGLNTTSKTEHDISNTKWLLKLIDDRSSNKVQEYEIILARRPFLIRTADGMNGRAVQVHQGYLLADENKERRSPLVVKTSWQPVSKTLNNQPHEAYFYNIVFKERLVAASVVKAKHGLESDNGGNSSDSEDVSTFHFIRRGIQDRADFEVGKQMNNYVAKFSKNKVRAGDTVNIADKKQIDEMKESMAYMAFSDLAFSADHQYFAEDISTVTNRVQTRIVLNIWGWPIKFFKDLRELLTVVQGAIKDHQTMYNHNILHRDVSAGNIIIQPALPNLGLPLRQLVTQTSGKLIDLDHAKLASKRDAPEMSMDIYDYEIVSVRRRHNVTKNAVIDAWKFADEGAGLYCKAAIASNVLESEPTSEWSSQDLGWQDVGKVPDYTSHVPSVIERTGTIPFISHQVMTKKVGTVHNAIHDLESFWWVVVYLCLTRESGGGHRRKDTSKELHTLVRDLFESSDSNIGISKAVYFDKDTGKASFETLSNFFSKYFEPLKPMLNRWRSVLTLGYTFKGYEYHLVHEYVLTIISQTLNDPKMAAPERSEVIDSELRRREVDYRYICGIGSSTNVPTPAPILMTSGGTSPTRNRGVPPSSRPTTTNPPSSPTPASKVQKKK